MKKTKNKEEAQQTEVQEPTQTLDEMTETTTETEETETEETETEGDEEPPEMDGFLCYDVKLAIPALNVRKAPDPNADVVRILRDQSQFQQIIEEFDNPDGTKWGQIGEDEWINLFYTEKVE